MWCRIAVPVLALAALTACPDRDGRDRFRSDVAPVLERRCLSPACHGVRPGAEAAGDVIDRAHFFVDVDDAGRIRDLEAAYQNVKGRINTVEAPELSTLLRKPLALSAGGVVHAGGHAFADRDAPDWVAVRDWIASESGGGEGTPYLEISLLEYQFATTVLPVLRDRGCMVARCHGPLAFGGLPLTTPMEAAGITWSVAEIRANREAARATLALAGDPARSRLLTKALPLDAGGIPHRGGNDTFFPHVGTRDPREDPGARAIVAWAAAERAALPHGDAPLEPSGLLFVRGPAAPRALLDLDTFRPGSDVWYQASLAPGAPAVNLTAAAHEGPADVRDPALSHDGQRVAFAMRLAPDQGHDLYELRLDGTGLRRLTFDGAAAPGRAPATSRWPVWGPGDRLYYASSRAGEADESSRGPDLELYGLGDDGAPVRLTFTPTPELAPSFLATGEFRGSLAFTTVRRRDGATRGAVFRFPPDHDRAAHLQPEYHPHHGQTAGAAFTWTLRELPDGRDLAILLDGDVVWEGGQLVLIERQFGPDAPAGTTMSVPGFRHAVMPVDATAATHGASAGGFYRDPAPLPDGRLLVAHAPGALDLGDAAAAPDSAIELLELTVDAAGATVTSRVVVADAPGLADDQPVPVLARPDEDDAHDFTWDPAAPTGILRHSGVLVNEAVNRRLAATGDKLLRDDVVTARLVAWRPWRLDDGVPVVDPALVANGDPASTWWSNGVHGPVAPLAELPLAPDGTFVAALPAGTPVRVQLVDRDGLARGKGSALWIHVQGGERFPQGAQPGAYPRLCAGCHGALDGDPGHALPPAQDPDAVTGASLTLAAYEQGNPRRPRPPTTMAATPAGFEFGAQLGPVLARSCALGGCHAGTTPAGGLDLTPTPTSYYDRGYEALQVFGPGSTGGKKYVDERGASAWGSFLMEKLTGRELGAPRVLDFRCPPDGSGVAPLTADELRAWARWIDLGAIYRTPGSAP